MARKGVAPRSGELAAALSLLGGLAGAAASARSWGRSAGLLWELSRGAGDPVAAVGAAARVLGDLVLLPCLGAAAGAAAAHAVTGGLVPALRLDLSRLDPVAGLGRVFGGRALAEALRVLLYVAVVSAVSYPVLRSCPEVLLGGPAALGPAFAGLIWRLAAAALACGVLGAVWRRWEYERGIAMTPEELKEELREAEGDPLVRRRLREWMRKVAAARVSVRNVRRASVVVTNPTRYAVALRYVHGETPAPVVVGKGVGRTAEAMRREAARLGVPVVPDPPLARALYRVDVGRAIPPELYRAVAEVLARLWRASRREGLV